MDQIITLLENLAHTAYKTQETLKTISSYPEASGLPSINQLDLLLDKIKFSSIGSTYEIVAGASQSDIQETIHSLERHIESLKETSAELMNAINIPMLKNLRNQFAKNIQSLLAVFES